MKDSTKVYLYTGGWIFYYLQGIFHLEGSLITSLLIVGLIVVSFLYVVLCHFSVSGMRGRRISMFILSLDAFILLLTIYGIIYLFNDSLYSEGTRYNYLKNIYGTLFPIYFFYYYAIKGILETVVMKKITIAFFIFVVINYILLFLRENATMMTNNGGYLCVAVVPLTLLFEDKKVLQNIMVLILSVLTVVSMKRGAMLVMLILLILFIFIRYKREENKIRTTLFVLFLISVIAVSFIYLWNANEYFYARLYKTLNGYTSGRDELYSTLIQAFFEDSSDMQFVFGRGAWSSLVVTKKNYAHSDWLELATNQGVMGVLFYFVYICSIVKTFFCKKVWCNQTYILFMVSVVVVMKSFFSMSYSSMDVILFATLGYAMGIQRRECVINR